MTEMAAFVGAEIHRDTKVYEATEPLHHLSKTRRKTYDDETVRQIQIVYILAAIIWVVLIFVCGWFKTKPLGLLLLAIPLFVFAINYHNAIHPTVDLESDMFQGNFLSFAFLITVILINWKKVGDKRKIFKILMISLVMIMLSLIDVWVDRENLILVKHVRTILQTSGLLLLAYGLYTYYVDTIDNPWSHIMEYEF